MGAAIAVVVVVDHMKEHDETADFARLVDFVGLIELVRLADFVASEEQDQLV